MDYVKSLELDLLLELFIIYIVTQNNFRIQYIKALK